jgi:preprotein translocase subunit SecB
MEHTQPANFQLQGFNIPKVYFEEPESNFSIVDIRLEPSGTFNTSNGDYSLSINFAAIAKDEKQNDQQKTIIDGILKASYKIEQVDSSTEPPDFFYQNSLAIIFPYIRAFISNITLQSGNRLLIIPLLNLTGLSETLKKNTKFFK